MRYLGQQQSQRAGHGQAHGRQHCGRLLLHGFVDAGLDEVVWHVEHSRFVICITLSCTPAAWPVKAVTAGSPLRGSPLRRLAETRWGAIPSQSLLEEDSLITTPSEPNDECRQ